MRVPQVSERIKEAPAQALRGVFAGIGQLLLITDKLKNKASHQEMPWARTPGTSGAVTDATVTSPPGQAAAPAGSATETTPAAAVPAAPAPAPAEAVAAKPAAAEPAAARPATARRPAAKPAAGKPVTPKPGAKPVTAKPPTARRQAAPAEPAGQPPPKPPKQQSTRDFDKTGNVRLLGGEKDSSASSAAAPATPGEAPLPNYDELSVASLRARLRNLDVTQVRQLAEYERAHAARADVLTMFERRIAKLEAEA
jgi:hypothetical protein